METFGSGDYQYEVVEGWGIVPQLGLVSGVACDSPDGIWIDSIGDIYGSEVIAEKRLQKFTRV